MNELLRYPFDSKKIMLKRKSIKKELLETHNSFITKNIAILGGSTTHDIKEILELFLLNYGIKPFFFESEYGMYWEDAMFGDEKLKDFSPDIFFIHTSFRNITELPCIGDSVSQIEAKLENQYNHFEVMWKKIKETYDCPIIQNNFEYPFYRLLGNQDVVKQFGYTNFVNKLNERFYNYSNIDANFFINDINYLSADYGLSKWSDPVYWYMYKYCLSLDAIPNFAFSISNIIKSIFGKNKKAFALDLDNTLWGGVIGDDGVDNLELGQETSKGQAYSEFQSYLKLLQKQGIILNVISKNDENNAMIGLKHPQMLLKQDDFISIKANWEPKCNNLIDIANEISLMPDSFVFVDDNPAEREIVRQQIPNAGIPEMDKVEHYISSIDHAGYFETTYISVDDLVRNQMYKENVERINAQKSFTNYKEYLLSLKMKAVIKPFDKIYLSRIAQLTNKSNQFNLTTKRFTQEEIEKISENENFITLYGKLEDRFGDNGIVSLVIGEIKGEALNIVLWLMSCRVLKRDMEYAMMDEIIKAARSKNIKYLNGYYYPTEKNSMVKNFFELQGFEKQSEDSSGNTTWKLTLTNDIKKKNDVIEVISIN